MQLLIAHRDETARQALRHAVAELDGEVEIVESADGEETMEILLATDSPRVAVVDWDLPGCDGLELCRLVRTYYQAGRPYIILLARRGYRLADGLEAGADDCVYTPVPSDELRARIGAGRRLSTRAWASAGRRSDEDAELTVTSSLDDVEDDPDTADSFAAKLLALSAHDPWGDGGGVDSQRIELASLLMVQ
jgi:DNA-binding response OmpR family regulator